MATYSQMKTGLDEISARIRAEHSNLSKAKTTGSNSSVALSAIPTDYAEVIAAIDAIPANTTNAAEMLLKAEKAKLTAEFVSLKSKADAIAATALDS